MRITIFIIAIVFLFGCKKENIEPFDNNTANKEALPGKLKSLNQYQFFYDSNNKELKSVKVYDSATNTLNDYIDLNFREKKIIIAFANKDTSYAIITPYNSIKRILKKDYPSAYPFQQCVLTPFNKDYQLIFNDGNFITGAIYYKDLKKENGNYVYCNSVYSGSFGGPIPFVYHDTNYIEYTSLPFNKNAPFQGIYSLNKPFFLYSENPFELYVLGLNNKFLYQPNRNLIKSVKSISEGKINYEYEFNAQNQLVKMKRYKDGLLLDEFSLDYY